MYLRVYIVMSDYLCVFICIYACLCVYIVMCDYLCLFLIKYVKFWAYIFTICLKWAKRLINIYLHNNWGYIAQSYTLLYIIIMRLRLKNAYLFTWYLLVIKNTFWLKNVYCGNGVLFFAWDLGVFLFRHTKF